MATSIHFPASQEPDGQRKVLRLRVNDADENIQRQIATLSSLEIRELLGVTSYEELRLKAEKEMRSVNSQVLSILRKSFNNKKLDKKNSSMARAGTYSGGRGDFFHDLFPYLEAFSPQFVEDLAKKYKSDARIILDPFGGCGTTPLTFTSNNEGRKAYYCEINPVMQRVIELKEFFRNLSEKKRSKLKEDIGKLSDSFYENFSFVCEDDLIKDSYRKVFEGSDIFEDSTLSQVLKLKTEIIKLQCTNEPLGNALEIATLSSLVPASNMQRAGDLRRKRPKERERISADIYYHVRLALEKIASGISDFSSQEKMSILLTSDSRGLSSIPTVNADIVITSPPYLNGTNYFRNTKVELWFLGAIKEKGDLGILRDKAITAGINDVRGIRSKQNPSGLAFESLSECLKGLDEHAYDRRIPKMVRWYAHDLNQALSGTIFHLKSGGTIAIDIGDSVYSNIKVPTDKLVAEILENNGCRIVENLLVRERMSRSGQKVKQVCIVAVKEKERSAERYFDKQSSSWVAFRKKVSGLSDAYKKRNWGHSSHSLCSYQGKLKPAIGNFLVDSFVPSEGKFLDPFSGVGTIPFEGALAGKKSYGFDLSPAGVAISRAKVWAPRDEEVKSYFLQLCNYVEKNAGRQSFNQWLPDFNKNLVEYYHEDTLREILAAREWFALNHPWNQPVSLLLACTMHVLHGNRPYALSRRSHPVTPFSPTGDFLYKSLKEKVWQKVSKVLGSELPENFVDGKIFETDATKCWPEEVDGLDAVITSPPFFASTRFYSANWIRLWFSGWGEFDFKAGGKQFLETKQLTDFACYDNIFRQSKERLKEDGVLLLHLGKSNKCDMADVLSKRAKYWFSSSEVFDEDVAHCESHGISDKGGVTDHQYLLLY
ncbi:hypothetical protein HPA02_15990 [Bisbaumannia pacifica]|uniref:site-specific DNA-methyltransferase (cytosine-N(4)-specific) n=1 Tax=Bisbaumannia pacifica TaxID=77098 RepID=A0A510X7A0_9GAMM|nr:hypothetical protein [Halomonas pacifica]GEK47316.1 hypothetical protein HPA02_15990 [Halomonas pacifica]